jgi:fructan beta-fructosidase
VRYDAAAKQLICKGVVAPLHLVAGRVRIEFLADRGSVEVFGNSGRVALSAGGVLPADNHSIHTKVNGRGAKLRSLKITELKSAWK